MSSEKGLTSIEIRKLMLDTLAYEDDDIDKEGNNFKKYGYQGTQSDLFRLMEGLAIKNGILDAKIPLSRAAWGGRGMMPQPQGTTNFCYKDIQYIYEQFHLLLNQGVISPGAVGGYGSDLPNFHVTDYGMKCLEQREILPYDMDGYLLSLKNIADITEWVEFYIKEALQCYNANCMEAAVIMLGLANEKIIDDLNEALLVFLDRNYQNEYEQMATMLSSAITASAKYNCYITHFNAVKNHIGDQDFKDMLPLMDRVAIQSFANFTRITRNELSHPSDAKMERMEVLMIFISFVKYCKAQYGFISFFSSH